MNAPSVGSASTLAHLVSRSAIRRDALSATFRFAPESVPYLVDHRVHDVAILPGALYLDMARCLDAEVTHGPPGVVRNIEFHHPVVLPGNGVLIRVDIRTLDGGLMAYEFRDVPDQAAASAPPSRGPAATLLVDRIAAASPARRAESPALGALRSRVAAVDGERFYARLAANGNGYGPAFRRIEAAWPSGREVLGRLVPAVDAHARWPTLFDAMTQLLAAAVWDRGRTFMLRSIERVELARPDLPAALWAHAVLEGEDAPADGEFVGTVRAFDGEGRRCVELSGVAFASPDPGNSPAGEPVRRVVVSSNFTAQPVEDALLFWARQFARPIAVDFAPYDQVCQQLLDPCSALARNHDGDNVLLLGLEDWAAGPTPPAVTTAEHVARALADQTRTVLPDGREIAHLNQYETDHLYREIVDQRAYLRHGVRLPRRGVVVDVGANIGLFSLFAAAHSPDVRILAFEPAPAAFEALRANGEAYAPNLEAFNVGVCDRPGTAPFTFYARSSVFSGFHADEAADRAALGAVVRTMLGDQPGVDPAMLDAEVEALTRDRLNPTPHLARTTSVSAIIREHRLDRIDLLKIDVERSEWEVLAGIADDDWPIIAQIVLEIHDPTGELAPRIETVLAAHGYRCKTDHERVLEDAGMAHLYAVRPAATVDDGDETARAAERLQIRLAELRNALTGFARGNGAPPVICICPRTPAGDADDAMRAVLDDAEARLAADAVAWPGVRVIPSATVARWYPVREVHDPRTHRLGHIPYTPAGFAAIATAVVRTQFNAALAPYKVIALDCDNTLWGGSCAEATPTGVDVGGPYRALQEFMRDRMHAGLLLCLCSRNEERDVLAVFDTRADMILRREHLVARRVNWRRKSDNLRALARELNVGLDSFVFVDDDPVECADVRARCPEVLTLQLPPDPAEIVPFLAHVWPFDVAGATAEDRRRTDLYRADTERRQFRDRIPSLREFVRGLELRVHVSEPVPDDLERISQLTLRTNQFNTSGVRRSVRELEQFLDRADARALAVRVADRFGDYGLVGVVLYERRPDAYAVDTLLLSCRVLGRGVEHAVAAELGRRALADGRSRVELAFRESPRNTPARCFLERLAGGPHIDTRAPWSFNSARLADTTYDPDAADSPAGENGAAPRASAAVAGRPAAAGVPAAVVQRIADCWRDAGAVAAAVAAERISGDTPNATGADRVEAELLAIWRRVLGRSRIGLHDNYFDVGGTSLNAVQVVAQIQARMKRPMSIVELFEVPTVARLASRMRAGADSGATATVALAARRGRARRPSPRADVS